MATMRIPTEFTAIDKFTSVISKMTDSTNKFSNTTTASIDRFNKKANKVAGNMAIAGSAIVGGFGLAVNSASEFETKMSNVSTLIDTNVEDMDKMGKDVLKLAKVLPVPIDELTSSLYDIRSAGIPAKDAMAALETSARLAKAGLSTTSEATNIQTSAMNAFASEGLSANEIANLLFKTVKAGKTNMAELSQAFGANAAVIQSSGVKLADFQAATAALTVTGAPASQAQNQLKASIVALQKPTAEMTKIFQKLGVTSEKELIAKEGSLVGAFDAVNKAGKGMGINLAKAWSSVEASSAVTGLLGANNATYISTLKDMQSGTDELTTAFAKQQETTASKVQLSKNNMEALSITIGTHVAPILSTLIDVVTPLITAFTEWASNNQGVIKTIAKVGIGLLALSGIIKGVTIATSIYKNGLIAYNFVQGLVAFSTGASSVSINAQKGYMFAASVATKAMTASQWLLNAAMTANPIGLIIVGVVALIALVAVIINKWNEWGAALSIFLGPLGLIISIIQSFRTHWDSVVQAFQTDGILGGLKRIGLVLLDAILMPVQQLLELLAKIPGLGDLATAGAAKIGELRQSLELVPAPETKQAQNIQNSSINGNIGINVSADKGSSASVDSSFSGGIMPNVTSTQGAF